MSRVKNVLCRALRPFKYLFLTLLAVAVLWGVIMLRQINQPADVVTALKNQPLLAQMPSVEIADEGKITDLISQFPVAVMCPMPPGTSSGFVSGKSESIPHDNGFGRKITLEYSLPEGQVTVTSIYPATAAEQVNHKQYRLAAGGEYTLAGVPVSRWVGESGQLLTCQTEEAIYTVCWAGKGEIPETMLQSLQMAEISR